MTEILNYPKCYKHPGGEYFLLLVLTESLLTSESTTRRIQSTRIIAQLSLTLQPLTLLPGIMTALWAGGAGHWSLMLTSPGRWLGVRAGASDHDLTPGTRGHQPASSIVRKHNHYTTQALFLMKDPLQLRLELLTCLLEVINLFRMSLLFRLSSLNSFLLNHLTLNLEVTNLQGETRYRSVPLFPHLHSPLCPVLSSRARVC